MNRIEIEQAVSGNLDLIRGVVGKTLKRYRARLCRADMEDIASNTVLCLLDGRLDNYIYTTDKKLQTWIGYIAMQRTVDYLRALKKTISFQLDTSTIPAEKMNKPLMQMASLSSPDEPADEALVATEAQLDRRSRLRGAVLSLSEAEQQDYSAMSQDSYSVKSYAKEQGIKESSVHTRRHRLVRNIRKCF
jgi:RNA polymerase sigma factor (sigma-70 family)